MRQAFLPGMPGITWYFTVALQDRRSRWLVEHVDLLRDCVSQVKAKHPFRIDAMVVLPEHLHAIWTLPPDDPDFVRRWALIKRRFTRQLLCRRLLDPPAPHRRGEADRRLWQRGCRPQRIRDEQDLARHIAHVHFNPVWHGWVARAADWPHSSFHRHVRQGLLAPDWAPPAGWEGPPRG